MTFLADALDLLMQPCYQLTGNWWAAIALFTAIVKVILMPMSLWVQKNCIVMVRLMPSLNRIKVQHFGDREAIGDKQSELYKEQHYHPLLSLVPLAIQVLILFGLVDVIHRITDSGAAGTELLGLVPIEDGGIVWVMPLLAGVSAVVLGFAQNRINPLQREQSRAEKNMTNGISIALSLVLGVFVAAGMAFYWIASNLISIAVQALCNIIMDPRKSVDYADLEESRAELAKLEALDARPRRRFGRDPLTRREKADYKRFFSVTGKHLAFYSEGSGFYKYFQGAIEWLLSNSDVVIHYITNDPNDQVFALAERNSRIRAYYIGPKRIITLMMKMDADVVVTTLEDLDNYYIKRSYVRSDIEYVFMFHHMTSLTMTPTKEAYDHYDTLLVVGPHQVTECRAAEKRYGLSEKRCVRTGYDLLDRTRAGYLDRQASLSGDSAERPTVLIAPSWQDDCILDSCLDEVIADLLPRGWRIIVRPHPEYTKRYRARWEAILARYAHVPESDLYFERDFSTSDSVLSSDVLITDWSSVAYEFSFSTNKPCVFVNTPMKVNNPDYLELGLVPTDISWRDEVGVSIDPGDIDRLPDAVADMVEHPDAWGERIASFVQTAVFNLGHGGEAAGSYLLDAVLDHQKTRKEREDASLVEPVKPKGGCDER